MRPYLLVTEVKVRLRSEMWLVLGVSLGQSAVYAMLRMADLLTRAKPLNEQASNLNVSLTPDRPWLDLAYQLAGIFFGLVPALLAIHLLSRHPGNARGLLGLSPQRWKFDLGSGTLLALVIGLPGLGLYIGARELGFNTTVQAANLIDVWWTIPVLILAAAQNAILEEVVAIGYLFERLKDRWGSWTIIIASAVLRGSYHLYQGFGAFVGNAIMGVIFGWVYQRWGRLGPLIVAHTLLDIVAFVGYSLLAKHLPWI